MKQATIGSGGSRNAHAVGPVLSCTRLRCRIGNRDVIDIERLELGRSRSYLLTGPNGAGKTTLLRILAGLESAQCGELVFDGEEVDPLNYPERMRRRVGFVHHHPVLFDSSIADNIAYGLRAAGLRRDVVRARTQAAIEWAGIGALTGRSPRALSAGERQRVALARAHALDPLIYLLDEPTANLDVDGRELVTRLIDAIGREGRTLLIACHDRELLNLAGVGRLHLVAGRLEAAS